jgi:hypothetical protein
LTDVSRLKSLGFSGVFKGGMAMKSLSNSSQRSRRSEELASQPIGGPREFATFAVLILCFAITVAIVFGHRHRAANRANSQPTTSARRAIVPNPSQSDAIVFRHGHKAVDATKSQPTKSARRVIAPNPSQSDAIVFGHGHKAVDATRAQPATTAHRAIAPSPSRQPDARIASGKEYTAWVSSTAGSLGNSAVNVQNVVLDAIISLVWDPAVGLSNQIIGFVADSWVNPVTGDRIIFNAAPGASRMAVSILAFAMVGVVMLALAGPLYASWKTWRLSRAHGFRGRSQ